MKPLLPALLLLTSTFGFSAERVALVVGCGNYTADPALTLDTPLQDAQDLAALLQSPALGFKVVHVPDATATQFYAGLKKFKTAAQGARIALVYFSGHGIEQEGANYLITTNAELESAEALETETMPLEKVMRTLKDSGATVKLAILDCCRNNPFAQTKSKAWLRTKDFVRDQVLKELGDTDLPEATLVCFATSAGRKAAAVLDAQSTNSPFTDFLLQEMKTPGQSLRTIFENVHDRLKEATSGRQVPVVQTKNSVDELIRKTVLVAGPLPPQLSLATTSQPLMPPASAAFDSGAKPVANGPLKLGTIEILHDAAVTSGQRLALYVPLIAAQGVPIDHGAYRLDVFFYDQVNGVPTYPSIADSPVVTDDGAFDFKQGGQEVLKVIYSMPELTPAEVTEFGQRTYLGYVTKLYYQGKLMSVAAEPSSLLNYRAPAPSSSKPR